MFDQGSSKVVSEFGQLSDFREACYSSVLHLRGDSTHVQPFIDPTTGNILLYNGEVFRVEQNKNDLQLKFYNHTRIEEFDLKENDG